MSNFDDYITGTDKPFAENINDALLLSNVFDLTVPIQVPTMFRNSSWVDVTSARKCGVAILTLKESLPSGVSISTVDGKSVLTGTGTVKLGFYPNFNSFGSFKSIDWEETGTVQINLKTVNNTTIASNISKGLIQNPSPQLMTLQEIVLEIVLNNGTLKSLEVVMGNKQQERYGAEVGIIDVTGLDTQIDTINSRLSDVEDENSTQDSLINAKLDKDDLLDLVYPVGAIYMSVNSANPGALFGGTWERLKDKFLLAAGDTFSNGSTGGSKDAVVVAHNHTQNSHNHEPPANFVKFLVATGDIAVNGMNRYFTSAGGDAYFVYAPMGGADSISEYRYTSNATPTISSSGESGTNKNMPPYLAVYMWKRTA